MEMGSHTPLSQENVFEGGGRKHLLIRASREQGSLGASAVTQLSLRSEGKVSLPLVSFERAFPLAAAPWSTTTLKSSGLRSSQEELMEINAFLAELFQFQLNFVIYMTLAVSK